MAMRLLSMQSPTGPEEETNTEDEDDFLKHSMLSCSSIFHESSANNQLKKGILWQQRDKIFSRWKERFFVLTKDYLQCFKKGTSRITEMGGFIYGIRLNEVTKKIFEIDMC